MLLTGRRAKSAHWGLLKVGNRRTVRRNGQVLKGKMQEGEQSVEHSFVSQLAYHFICKSYNQRKSAMISCPECSTVLRRIDGLHQQGEPYMQLDERGSFMLCLKCGARVPWEDQDPTPGLDFGDDMAPA